MIINKDYKNIVDKYCNQEYYPFQSIPYTTLKFIDNKDVEKSLFNKDNNVGNILFAHNFTKAFRLENDKIKIIKFDLDKTQECIDWENSFEINLINLLNISSSQLNLSFYIDNASYLSQFFNLLKYLKQKKIMQDIFMFDINIFISIHEYNQLMEMLCEFQIQNICAINGIVFFPLYLDNLKSKNSKLTDKQYFEKYTINSINNTISHYNVLNLPFREIEKAQLYKFEKKYFLCKFI